MTKSKFLEEYIALPVEEKANLMMQAMKTEEFKRHIKDIHELTPKKSFAEQYLENIARFESFKNNIERSISNEQI